MTTSHLGERIASHNFDISSGVGGASVAEWASLNVGRPLAAHVRTAAEHDCSSRRGLVVGGPHVAGRCSAGQRLTMRRDPAVDESAEAVDGSEGDDAAGDPPRRFPLA